MKYDKVDRSHVVPQGYLRSFSDEEGKLTLEVINPRKTIERASVKDVGVRRRFYSRERRDGERIDDVEWMLQAIEDKAPPILKTIRERWPCSAHDRQVVAEFAAMQIVRGPRWHEGYRRRTKAFVDEWDRREGFEDFTESGGPSAEEVRAINEAHFLSNTHRLVRMMSLYPKASSILGSMNWSLVTFETDALAASDHPVVGWPLAVRAQEPQAIDLYETGLLNMVEIRYPVSPRTVILMTWLDEERDRPVPISGASHHAQNLNAFTVANADNQWFYLPGSKPRVGTGRFTPISAELLNRYDAARAARSQLRAATGELVRKRAGQTLQNSYEIARINYGSRSAIER